MPDLRSLWADPSAREPRRGWLHRAPVPPPPPPQDEPPPPRRSPLQLALVAFAALAALLLAGAAGAFVTRQDVPRSKPVRIAKAGLSIGAIYTAIAPAVVQVHTSRGSGSGFVVQDDGSIVTSAHVVRGASHIRVVFDDAGDPIPARILGTDPSTDLAVLKIDPAKAPRLRPIPLGDSDKLAVGDPVIGISYPLGLDRTAASSIVSGFAREVTAAGGFSTDKVIQTNAPSTRAAAGGPLLNAKGLVVGVNVPIVPTGTAGATGVGFAVPASTVREVVTQLILGQNVERPFLGVETVATPAGDGALVVRLAPNGPAYNAGLQSAADTPSGKGDVIVGIGPTPISSPDDVITAIAAHRPGDSVSLLVVRDNQRVTFDATLGTRGP